MKKDEELERVEFKIDEENPLRAVSIVTDPAIEKNFMLFKDVNIQVFKSQEDKMEITGVAMTPNKDILRKKEDGKFYNCWFSEETVIKAAGAFLDNGNNMSANFEHDQNSFTDKISVLESWIVVDPNMDKTKALGFNDISKGDWVITYKVKDKELWNEIKTSGFKGFSIEGVFGQYEKQLQDDIILSKLKAVLVSNISDDDKESLIRKIIYTK